MFWRDPSNVLEDIDQFSSLYIRAIGCIWSEYGVDNYDDDGENRDGDENWYQGRTTTFRANAAYSLYGIKKGQTRVQKCSRYTYINSFITNAGADTILNVLGRGNNDDDNGYGNAYCQEVDQDDNGRDRNLGSGDSGDQNDNDSVSTTMGCSLTGNTYVMATFQGAYCDGNYFLGITDDMKDYNKAMSKVTCDKIWDYSQGYSSGERVETAADTLLATSLACSSQMYGKRCPDPYGIIKKYRAAVTGRSGAAVQTFFRITSWIAFLVGLGLMTVAYYARYRKRIHRIIARLSKRRKKDQSERGDDQETITTTVDEKRSSSPTKKKKKKRSSSSSRGKSSRRPGSRVQKREIV
jgi:hypothetical protein